MCQAGMRGFDSVSACINELIAAKTNANRTCRYVTSLQYYLRQFAFGREGKPLSDFTLSDIESWLARYPSAYTRQTWLNRISTLFSFAVRRGFISQNVCDRIERITVDKKAPVILTPDQAALLMKACPTMVKPYFILAMFAGVRPEEVCRLDWKNVNLETGTVAIEGKTRRRRIVKLEPIALRLLAAHPLRSGPVSPSRATLTRWKFKSRKTLGLERWPQDLLRHTAASYMLALHKDAGKVAMTLGNSASVLLSHYHEPVTEKAAAFFWDLDGHTKSHPVGLEQEGNQQQSFTSGQTDRQNQPKGDASHETPSIGARAAEGSESEQSLHPGVSPIIAARVQAEVIVKMAGRSEA